MAEIEKNKLDKRAHLHNGNLSIQIKHGKYQRRYNEPHHDKVAIVFVGDDDALPANCDPMTYTMLFPRGDMGWHCNLQHLPVST